MVVDLNERHTSRFLYTERNDTFYKYFFQTINLNYVNVNYKKFCDGLLYCYFLIIYKKSMFLCQNKLFLIHQVFSLLFFFQFCLHLFKLPKNELTFLRCWYHNSAVNEMSLHWKHLADKLLTINYKISD